MTYILEHTKEADRLEKQATQPSYNIEEELKHLSINSGDKILDAGCGTGILSRHLANRFSNISIEACDRSAIRLKQARELSGIMPKDAITYFECDLVDIPVEENHYNTVINRFVLEHMSTPLKALEEFYRILKPGGTTFIIDLDGILFNIYTENEELNQMLAKLNSELAIDLFVGRKIPTLMRKAGFSNIVWLAETMQFQGEELQQEFDNYKDRFTFAKPIIANVLGEKKTEEFIRLYLEEMMKEGNVLFYNKFIVQGTKG